MCHSAKRHKHLPRRRTVQELSEEDFHDSFEDEEEFILGHIFISQETTAGLQKSDPETAEIRDYCTKGWPAYMPESPLIKQYWTDREHLTIVDDLLLLDCRIVIPRLIRLEMPSRIEEGHLRIVECRALHSLSGDRTSPRRLKTLCKNVTLAPNTEQPKRNLSYPPHFLIGHGQDLVWICSNFTAKPFLIVVDYYSRCWNFVVSTTRSATTSSTN